MKRRIKVIRILHLCLCGPVSDGWTYQDNLISKYHARLGHDVTLIASRWILGNDGKLTMTETTNYYNKDGVKMIRLKTNMGDVNTKFKLYPDLYQTLKQEQADVIFAHGLMQCRDAVTVARYMKHHPGVRLYVDSHADFSNSATNWVSKNILHKIIWKHYAKVIAPYVTKFYGVLPARVEFLKKVYGLPDEKVDLLVMGADDDLVDDAAQPGAADEIRRKHGIAPTDFLIMTGGKIDAWKTQTLLLMEAVQRIQDPRVKLIVFGSVTTELKDKVKTLADGVKVKYIGWIKSDETYRYFAAADLAVFPGRHSVLWEQVVGQGIPVVVKHWQGTTHVDVGGNCKFLYQDSVEEINKALIDIIEDPSNHKRMKDAATRKGLKTFSYRDIAARSIDKS